MSLQEKVKADLKLSMKAKNETRTSALRVLLGEFQRQPRKELGDADVLSIIRKLIKSENELLEKKGEAGSDFLNIMQEYMPRQADDEQVRTWIRDNIDFSQYKNKMMAMKQIMSHFAGTVDGNTVKKILESL